MSPHAVPDCCDGRCARQEAIRAFYRRTARLGSKNLISEIKRPALSVGDFGTHFNSAFPMQRDR